MGEARRNREARAAREAAWRLGGELALRELVAHGENIVCPLCDRNGLVDAGEGAPRGARKTCPLCQGKGGLRRPAYLGPPDSPGAYFRDHLVAVSRPRRP